MQYVASPARGVFSSLLSLTAAAACSGTIDGGGPSPDLSQEEGRGGAEMGSPGAPDSSVLPPPALPVGSTLKDVAHGYFPADAATLPPPRLWLLTHAQLDNTVASLFSVRVRPSSFLDPELLADGFRNQAAYGAVDVQRLHGYARAAAAVAAEAVKAPEQLLSCRPANPNDATCVQQFVRSLLPRAYRRPVQDAEVENFLSLYRKAAASFDGTTALRLVITTVLRSPHFLYRVETGVADPARPGIIHLDNHAIASALSYALWDAPPDAELAAMAAEGALSEPATREAQIARLVADRRAEPVLARFVAQWLGYDEVGRARKDRGVFPFFDADFARMVQEGSDRFVGDILRRNGGLTDLLRSTYVVSHTEVAKQIYGADVAAQDDAFAHHVLDPAERGGVVLQPAFLSSHAGEAETKVTERGLTLLRAVTCQSAPPPPAGVDTSGNAAAKDAPTTRARFEAHATNPSCAGCHRLFDPLGLALERYDAVGRYRTHEASGAPIDPSGTVSLPEGETPFADAPALLARLAASSQVHQCFVRHAFRYFAGRRETDGDDPALRSVFERFVRAQLGLRELMAALLVQPMFAERQTRI